MPLDPSAFNQLPGLFNQMMFGPQMQHQQVAEMETAFLNALTKFSASGAANPIGQFLTNLLIGNGEKFDPIKHQNIALAVDVLGMTKLGQAMGMENPMLQQNIMRGWMEYSSSGLIASSQDQLNWHKSAETSRKMMEILEGDRNFAYRGNVRPGDMLQIQDWLLRTQNISYDEMTAGPSAGETLLNPQSNLTRKVSAATKAVFYGKNLLGMGEDVINILNTVGTLGGGSNFEASFERFQKQVDAALSNGIKVVEMQDAMQKSMAKIQTLTSTGMDATTAAGIVFPAVMSATILKHQANLKGMNFDAEDASNRVITAHALMGQTEEGLMAKSVISTVENLASEDKRDELLREYAADPEGALKRWASSDDPERRKMYEVATTRRHMLSDEVLAKTNITTQAGSEAMSAVINRKEIDNAIGALVSNRAKLSKNSPDVAATLDTTLDYLKKMRSGTMTLEEKSRFLNEFLMDPEKAFLLESGDIDAGYFRVALSSQVHQAMGPKYADKVRDYISNMQIGSPQKIKPEMVNDIISAMGGGIDKAAWEAFKTEHPDKVIFDPSKVTAKDKNKTAFEAIVARSRGDNNSSLFSSLDWDAVFGEDAARVQSDVLTNLRNIREGKADMGTMQLNDDSEVLGYTLDENGKVVFTHNGEQIDLTKQETLEKFGFNTIGEAKAFIDDMNELNKATALNNYDGLTITENREVLDLKDEQAKEAYLALRRKYEIGDALQLSDKDLASDEALTDAIKQHFGNKIDDDAVHSMVKQLRTTKDGKLVGQSGSFQIGNSKTGGFIEDGKLRIFDQEAAKDDIYKSLNSDDKTAANTKEMTDSMKHVAASFDRLVDGNAIRVINVKGYAEGFDRKGASGQPQSNT